MASRTQDIKIYNIARTVVDREEVQRWLNDIGAEDYEIPDESSASSPALLIALAAKRCYKSFEPGLNPNVTKVRRDMAEYLDNVLKSGHGSVLEHSVYSFAIEGVSRVFTAEMNRHRAGWAISEGSLRFIRFDKDLSYWLPQSLQPIVGGDPELEARKTQTRVVFEEAFTEDSEHYRRLLTIWDMDASDKNFAYKKKFTSLFRRIVGMGVSTGGVWTGNMRALRHVVTMRAEPAAEEEIFHVFHRIGMMMVRAEPLLFGDFFQVDGQNGQSGWQPKNRKV